MNTYKSQTQEANKAIDCCLQLKLTKQMNSDSVQSQLNDPYFEENHEDILDSKPEEELSPAQLRKPSDSAFMMRSLLSCLAPNSSPKQHQYIIDSTTTHQTQSQLSVEDQQVSNFILSPEKAQEEHEQEERLTTYQGTSALKNSHTSELNLCTSVQLLSSDSFKPLTHFKSTPTQHIQQRQWSLKLQASDFQFEEMESRIFTFLQNEGIEYQSAEEHIREQNRLSFGKSKRPMPVTLNLSRSPLKRNRANTLGN